MSTQRLSLTRNGQIRYQLKTPYNDGTTHVIFEPLDFIARLVAPVPRPRVNLTRYHRVFAPHFKHRVRTVPRRTRGRIDSDKPLAPMTWAQRLKRVFATDIEYCPIIRGQRLVLMC